MRLLITVKANLSVSQMLNITFSPRHLTPLVLAGMKKNSGPILFLHQIISLHASSVSPSTMTTIVRYLSGSTEGKLFQCRKPRLTRWITQLRMQLTCSIAKVRFLVIFASRPAEADYSFPSEIKIVRKAGFTEK